MNEIRIVKVNNGYILYTNDNKYAGSPSISSDMYVYESLAGLCEHLDNDFNINENDIN